MPGARVGAEVGGAVYQARNRKRMIQSSDVISAASQNTQGHREKEGKKELGLTGVQELNISEN